MQECFRRHVGRRANIVLQARLLMSFDLAISKIDYLDLSIMQQNVGRLQVAVHDSLPDEAALSL